ncbi:MAG TPA: hypothetical protein VJT15_06855 [Pyrinomonadaceae bacterium]|nr:hypothetical protein [Pyrinomonadaceae bacterium]
MLEHQEHEENVDRLFHPTPNDGPPLLWLKSQARYVRARLNGRALVTAWLPGGRSLAVDAVLALRDQSVVLQGHLEDGGELHVSLRADDVVIEMRPAPEGVESTLFAFIGVSRTPQPLLPRLKEAPAPTGHHGGGGHHDEDHDH